MHDKPPTISASVEEEEAVDGETIWEHHGGKAPGQQVVLNPNTGEVQVEPVEDEATGSAVGQLPPTIATIQTEKEDRAGDFVGVAFDNTHSISTGTRSTDAQFTWEVDIDADEIVDELEGEMEDEVETGRTPSYGDVKVF